MRCEYLSLRTDSDIEEGGLILPRRVKILQLLLLNVTIDISTYAWRGLIVNRREIDDEREESAADRDSASSATLTIGAGFSGNSSAAPSTAGGVDNNGLSSIDGSAVATGSHGTSSRCSGATTGSSTTNLESLPFFLSFFFFFGCPSSTLVGYDIPRSWSAMLLMCFAMRSEGVASRNRQGKALK